MITGTYKSVCMISVVKKVNSIVSGVYKFEIYKILSLEVPDWKFVNFDLPAKKLKILIQFVPTDQKQNILDKTKMRLCKGYILIK